MLILSSQFNPLCHTLWVCTRSWTLLYLQHHYGVLARWPRTQCEYHSCQCSQVDHAWRVFLRQQIKICLQWVSWPPLHKYGGFKIYFLHFTSCSRLLRYAVTVAGLPSAPLHAVLDLQSTQRTELVNCSFHGNPATALVVSNPDITLAGRTEFTHNRACGIIVLGGAIIASNSNLTFTGNTINLPW